MKPVRFYEACCPVRDRILIEKSAVEYISRELPTVFQVNDNASRENLSGYSVSTDILSLTGHFKLTIIYLMIYTKFLT
ncbi:MAG: hypothetical protein LBS69_12120 [Prevotellaceae bacterium]|nr:hypothetical protein [Prevotellaceae bacterium]